MMNNKLFESARHEHIFYCALSTDKTSMTDNERLALFYIISSDILSSSIKQLYDFEDHSIRVEEYEEHNTYSSGQDKLIKLAYNLYNGYGEETPVNIFSSLDSITFNIGLNAIQIRFNKLNIDFLEYAMDQTEQEVKETEDTSSLPNWSVSFED